MRKHLNIRRSKSVAMLAAILAAATLMGAAPVTVEPSSLGWTTPAQHLAHMTLQQRVGQLFMVAAAATGAGQATMNVLHWDHVGNVYLSGRSYAGISATAAVVRQMTSTVSAATTDNEYLSVGTDQEGGYVQVLNGPGFSVIPTALAQGGLSAATLAADAKNWGNQLRWAGVKVDLAPVLDTVTQAFAPYNAPIGYYEREYGYTPQTVSAKGNAFLAGIKAGYVMPTVKHFPGLGRVTGNTDVTANVHDTQTTINDPNLLPFQTAINNGARWVMVSSAYYDLIDSRPGKIAPFSTVVMGTMLRQNARFTGIILSDDLCSAAQLSPWSWAVRAENFVNAGGTMVLCANPNAVPYMYAGVLKLAQERPDFLAKVNAAVLTILTVKHGQ
ncbi:glycoside hydrolase family 3 N-terminal domain-containing protein [Arthrobacter sp. STN4]|uniref:glycoside hydrolase family 3 N-terminal domain-containing protein n=1 Tax=Arthrobacter sp. STN4 TaxID=2923276 RepID=UPI00211A49AB|nr:glycoside hydrolase family 3 N-terminal domain-containing protein [Arthrobacter sp. STN4]MCQ9165348.1 glycoside hydrolase family 3 protein [Arthrobacter sp. STN4]